MPWVSAEARSKSYSLLDGVMPSGLDSEEHPGETETRCHADSPHTQPHSVWVVAMSLWELLRCICS